MPLALVIVDSSPVSNGASDRSVTCALVRALRRLGERREHALV